MKISVCIDKEIDKQLLEWLNTSRNRSNFIRCVLYFYMRHNIGNINPNECCEEMAINCIQKVEYNEKKQLTNKNLLTFKEKDEKSNNDNILSTIKEKNTVSLNNIDKDNIKEEIINKKKTDDTINNEKDNVNKEDSYISNVISCLDALNF